MLAVPRINSRIWQLGAIFLVAYFITAYGAYQVFTTRIPSGNDFYSRWRGARALLIEGKDPYSEEITLQIQLGMYGRPQAVDKDQVAFAYPLYVIFTFLPLIPLDYAQAQALWMSALVYLIIGTVLITFQTIREKAGGLELLVLSLGALLFYPAGRGIILGQFAILVLFFLAVAWWAITLGKDQIAGALLALSTIKPQMVIFVLPFILLWALVKGRWGVLAGFGFGLIALFGLSAILLSDWLPKFVESVANYQAYTAYYTGNRSPIGLGLYALLGDGEYWPNVILSLLLGGYTLLVGYRALKNAELELWKALGVTSVATLLIPVQTGSTNQVLLLWPLLFWLRNWQSQGGRSSLLATLLSILVVVVPWFLFLSTVVGYKEHPLMALPIPLFALLVFTLAWPITFPPRVGNE